MYLLLSLSYHRCLSTQYLYQTHLSPFLPLHPCACLISLSLSILVPLSLSVSLYLCLSLSLSHLHSYLRISLSDLSLSSISLCFLVLVTSLICSVSTCPQSMPFLSLPVWSLSLLFFLPRCLCPSLGKLSFCLFSLAPLHFPEPMTISPCVGDYGGSRAMHP